MIYIDRDIIYSNWLEIIVCVDGFDPQLAQIACETIAEQSDDGRDGNGY